MLVVDLNADVGEWDLKDAGDIGDAALMPFITSANVACGVHAGNAQVMAATVALAARNGVSVGAHPGLDDREHFGRREVQVATAAVTTLVTDQLDVLAQIARQQGIHLRHVKPHGALYNMAARDIAIATAIAEAVARFDGSLTLVGLSGSELIRAGHAAGLKTLAEAFADRGYRPDGSLVPRSAPGAVLENAGAVADRAVSMVRDRRVVAVDGTIVPVHVDTICVHGDTAEAGTLARGIRTALDAAGVIVRAPR
jgi:5-oxoprolinase (ATP-hydrolysing) subunit A